MEALLTALKAAAEATRLRLLCLCAHSDLTVSDLTQILGQSQPRISRHLKLLCDAALLSRHSEGSWAYFRLAADGPGAHLARTLVGAVPATDRTASQDFERLERLLGERAQAADAYFRDNAADWDRIRGLYVDDAIVEARLAAFVPPGAVEAMLDIGTGTGRVIEVLGPRVQRATGIDRSHEMLSVARSRLQRAGLHHCAVRQGDMYALAFDTATQDLVTLHQVLHYAGDPGAAIAEAARVLKPGGRLLVVDFAAHGLQSLRQDHAHRWLGFEDAQMTAWLLAAGLAPRPGQRLEGDPLTVMIWPADRPAQFVQ